VRTGVVNVVVPELPMVAEAGIPATVKVTTVLVEALSVIVAVEPEQIVAGTTRLATGGGITV
jgi:hypothetical protein